MKLLLDQNLSRKLVPELNTQFPGTTHVYLLGFARWSDADLWSYARQHGFTLATKNTDMVDLCVVKGAPPKVLWLRVGNCSTAVVREVFTRDVDRILRFDEDPSRTVLSLYRLAPV